MMQKLTRRDFIIRSTKYLGLGLGAVTAGSGLFMPNKIGASDIHFPESSCGPEGAGKRRVLVAYASMYGSTGGIAEKIGEVLCEKGAHVDVRLIKNIHETKDYHAVIVGSAIRSSKWLSEAIEFVEGNKQTLGEKPVAYFLSCLTLFRRNETTLHQASSYLNSVIETVPQVKPVAMGLFSGALDLSKMSFPMRMIMQRKMKQKDIQEGDYRNWDSISAWTLSLDRKFIKS